ncbi:AprI/Inh family metalloprotease inhibitor [Pseudomonas aeruginosa]|uniref:AprI/Inh family metalloprotease inhibitor n=2 Tax=Pseudomonas aeruginosa TaxID=287 RepID=UPI000D6A01A6
MQAKRARVMLSGLALVGILGEVVMASTLRMPNAAELEGHWRIYPQQAQSQACKLKLYARLYALEGELECAALWLGGVPASWEPTPDGINVYSTEGRRLMHFGKQPEQLYLGRLPTGGFLVLERVVPGP